MKIIFNSYQPSFKAIQLDDNEKKQVTSTLQELKTRDLSDFQRNILKSDVMDVFIPHIKKEAAESDDPKAKSVDLNMKMFDALNSFADKKDPLGWFLSLLNGTEYKDPKPTIFDILEQKEEEERLAEMERKSKPVDPYASLPSAEEFEDMYFDLHEEKDYTKHEIFTRARELESYYGPQYKHKQILNIVEQNPYLVEYSNEDFDNYIKAFSEAVDIDPKKITYNIVMHPDLMHYSFDAINKKAEEYVNISGCDIDFCKSAIIRRPDLMTRKPQSMKHNLDAHNYYKMVRGKTPTDPNGIFTTLPAPSSYTNTLIFLVTNADKDVMKDYIRNDKQLIKHIKEQGVKQYRFVIPDDKMAGEFMDFAEDFAMDNFDENLFDFEVIDPVKYAHIRKPANFSICRNKNS